MAEDVEAPRRRARRLAGKIVNTVANSAGFEVVRRPMPAPAPPSRALPDNVELIPRGRTEPFQTDDYDVLPKGRYDIVERNYYSPVPDLSLLPDDIFDRRSTLGGVELDGEGAIAFVEAELAPFMLEFGELPIDGPWPPGQFFLRNQNYESVDAELLYTMVRAGRPQRVVELGSGYTTLLINHAARRNAQDGVHTEHIAYDPYPRAFIIGDEPPDGTRLESLSAVDVPFTVFEELEAGDILFVDTTHTVKLGSDVNHIVLDVLPLLQRGVIVHFHDIFIPFEYPRQWFEVMRYLWAEQYLLQAFLAYNSAFEVILPAQLLARDFPERLGAAIPSFAPGTSPGAMWLRRR